jgi:hypothetical protein
MTLARAVLLGVLCAVFAAHAQSAKPEDAKAAKKETPAAAPAAAPAPPPKPGPLDAACKLDMEAFCANVAPGGGRIMDCLVENEKQLSNTCRRRMDDLRTHGAECKDDIEKFCGNVPRAKGMLAKCINQHHDELSEGCKSLSAMYNPPAPKPQEAAKPPADAGAAK